MLKFMYMLFVMCQAGYSLNCLKNVPMLLKNSCYNVDGKLKNSLFSWQTERF